MSEHLTTDEQLALYPREVAAAAEMGLHPHEAIPRTGPTFLHERQQWIASTERTEAYARKAEQERTVAWEELKRCWVTLEDIERVAKELRKELPGEDPLRMKLLTLETVAAIRLQRKRTIGKQLLEKLVALGFDPDAPDEGETEKKWHCPVNESECHTTDCPSSGCDHPDRCPERRKQMDA